MSIINPIESAKPKKCYFSSGIDEGITCSHQPDFDFNGFPINPCEFFPCQKYKDLIEKMDNFLKECENKTRDF